MREGGKKPWAINWVPISLSWYRFPCLLMNSSKSSAVCSCGIERSRMYMYPSHSSGWNETALGSCLGWLGHPSTTVGRAFCAPGLVGVTQAEWQLSCPFKMSVLLLEWRNKNQGLSQGQTRESKHNSKLNRGTQNPVLSGNMSLGPGWSNSCS